MRLSSSTKGAGPQNVADHFAPRIIVGNTPAGDPAIAQAAPFQYIPDPGDGTGIAAACAAAAITPGDIWIRPGTYDFNLGAQAGPIAIPPNTRVYGAGRTTTLVRGRSTGNQGVFTLGAGAVLESLSVEVTGSGAGSVVSSALISAAASDNVAIRDVHVALVTNVAGVLRRGIFLGPANGIASAD